MHNISYAAGADGAGGKADANTAASPAGAEVISARPDMLSPSGSGLSLPVKSIASALFLTRSPASDLLPPWVRSLLDDEQHRRAPVVDE